MSNHRKRAEETWASVLEAMPSDLHAQFALVEARKRLIGDPDQDAVSRHIDRLAVKAFGESQLSGSVEIPIPAEPALNLRNAETIENAVLNAVWKTFEGTMDGSMEQAEAFRRMALEAAENVIAGDGSLGWFKRRKLRAIARKEADYQMKLSRERS